MKQKGFKFNDNDTRMFRDIKALLQAKSPVPISDIAVQRFMMSVALAELQKPPISVHRIRKDD